MGLKLYEPRLPGYRLANVLYNALNGCSYERAVLFFRLKYSGYTKREGGIILKWFYHMRISRKLLTVSSAICLFMAIVGAVGLYQLSMMNNEIRSMYVERFIPVIQLMEINKAISENSVTLMNAASTIQSDTVLENTIHTNIEKARTNFTAYSKNTLTKEEKNLLGSLESLLFAYEENLKTTLELAKKGDKVALVLRLNGSAPQKKALEDTINALVEIQGKKSAELYATAEKQFKQSWMMTIGLVSVGIILAIIFGTLLTRMVAGPINQVKARLEEMSRAGGDLTQRLTVISKDEVGQLAHEFNSMLESIGNIIREVLDQSKLVANTSNELASKAVQTSQASEQIAVAVKQIASGADTQVHSITETSVSMNQMSAGVQQISANNQEVTATAKIAVEIAQSGRDIIDRSMSKIETVTETVVRSADMMKHLGERSQAIGKIVGVITGIASQTNLLSLNAAIEAARAGEHGRGFAIVADEVRKLAIESGQAAQQIAELIKEIQQETQKVSEFMVAGTTDVQEGLLAAKEASQSFQQIHQAIETVTKQITEVSAATEQMVAGTEDVLQSVQTIVMVAEEATEETCKVNEVSEESRELMGEIVASAQSMNQIANGLHSLVSRFKV